MKKKVILVIGIILVVAALIAVSLFGIYVKNENGEKRNIIPNYKMGMEFSSAKKIIASVSDAVSSEKIFDKEGNEITEKEDGVEYTEENGYKIEQTKVNPDDKKTLENYKSSKETLKKKLDNLKIPEYILDMNESNGEVTIQIPDNEMTEETESMIKKTGSLIFIDLSTFEVVFTTDYVKSSDVVARQGDLEAAIFLQIKLTEDGITKLNELSEKYKETTETVTKEDGTTEEQTNKKELFVLLNGMSLGTTVLENIVYDNTIMIPFAVSNNNDELNTAMNEAQTESIILNSGMPILTYEYKNETVQAEITLETVLYYIGAIFVIFLVLFIFIIIRFKAKGFISMYFQIGFFAVMLLIMRLTNVTLTMEGIAGIVIASIVNYVFNYIMLKRTNEPGMYKETNLIFMFNTLPLFIIAIVFTFSTKATLSSFGMTIFWGIIMTYVYNFIFAKYVFENLTGGKADENSKNNN